MLFGCLCCFFFFKQKTAYEMRISDWSSDVCSSDLHGYDVLIAAIDEIEPQSKGNFGVWSLPDGEAYYADRLKNSTTTDLTADQIHELGLKQVAAIRQEMEAIQREVGFKGTPEQFLDHIRTAPKPTYPKTAAGRQAYLKNGSAAVRDRVSQVVTTR